MSRWLLLFLLVTPSIIQLSQKGSLGVLAEEDEIDEEDDSVVVDEEATNEEEENEEESILGKKNVSPDISTTLIFTQPSSTIPGSVELPAGQIVDFLVGFANKGDDDYIIETLDASLRYPMDFSYHMQNFSAIAYQKTVKANHEAAVAYSFIPADAFAGRPIGLTINMAYRDTEGNFFFDPVFNETVQITEYDEGFDTEVFFMWVALVALAILALFLVFSLFTNSKGKKGGPSGKAVETGTANDDDVDYEWIPRSALRTPGSNKTSPRQRKAKKGQQNSDSD